MQRYRMAFLLSLLVFISLWALYLHLPAIQKNPKKHNRQVIKIALLSPAVPKKVIEKKVVTKKTISKKATPKKTTPKKLIKKKVVHKKVVKSKKAQPKKIVKKRVLRKREVKRKITKRKVIKRKKIIHKKVIKKRVLPQAPIVEPIIEPIIEPIEQPIIAPTQEPLAVTPPLYEQPQPVTQPKVEMPQIETPKIEEPTFKTSSTPQPKVKNDQYKKAFLRNVRANIIANKRYPKLAKRRHIEGSVKVRFDITQTGEVTNIRFINGKRIFQKSIRKTLERTFPINIPNEVRAELPINDVSVVLHFNII